MEMKQIISITLLSLVATIFANPTGVAKPEECEVETPKYDEAACREACAKEPYSKEPYCEDVNQSSNTGTPVVPSAPGAQPGAGGVKTAVPDASPSVPSAPAAPSNTQNQQESGVTLPVGNQDVKGSEVHPDHDDSNEPSGGISLRSSLIISALCLFFKFIFI